MKKLEPLKPSNPSQLWEMGTTYDVIEFVWKKLDETRNSVNDAMDTIESDIQSNDYAAIKAMSTTSESKEVLDRISRLERQIQALVRIVNTNTNNGQTATS